MNNSAPIQDSAILLSLIIPVYNGEKYIPGIVADIYKQSVEKYEVLFINDGSKDNSRDIILEYSQKDDRIKLFDHGRNICQGAARNTGLNNAAGKYVMYIDVDDSFAPNYFEVMLKTIEKDESDIAICNSVWKYNDRDELHNNFIENPNIDSLLLTGRQALAYYFNIIKTGVWIPVEPWGKIVRRDFIEKYHIRHKENLFEDIVMTFNEICLADKISMISDYLYYYNRKNTECATNARIKEYVRGIYFVPEGILHVLNSNQLINCEEFVSLFCIRYINGAYSFFSKGQRLPEEFRYGLKKYGELLKVLKFNTKDRYICSQLFEFYKEMKAVGFLDLYYFFIRFNKDKFYEIIRSNKKEFFELYFFFKCPYLIIVYNKVTYHLLSVIKKIKNMFKTVVIFKKVRN